MTKKRGAVPKYPFATMEKGDSFTAPLSHISLITMYAYASKRGKELKRRFAVRRLDGSTLVVQRTK